MKFLDGNDIFEQEFGNKDKKNINQKMPPVPPIIDFHKSEVTKVNFSTEHVSSAISQSQIITGEPSDEGLSAV